MILLGYLHNIYNMAEEHRVPLQSVIDLIEFQEFKRSYKFNESNMELSCKVVNRYLGMESKNKTLLSTMGVKL